MQIASILSDLTSLRVCDHAAALALVTVHTSPETQTASSNSPPSASSSSSSARPTLSRHASLLEGNDDPDLQRAMDLVDLHYGVKEKYMHGADMGLQSARRDVQRAVEKVRGEGGSDSAGNRQRRKDPTEARLG